MRILFSIIATLSFFYILLCIIIFFFYQDRTFNNMYFLNYNISNVKREDLGKMFSILDERFKTFDYSIRVNNDVVFKINLQKHIFIDFLAQDKIIAQGKNNFFLLPIDYIKSFNTKTDISTILIIVNESTLKEELEKNFSDLQAVDYDVSYDVRSGEFSIIPGRDGYVFKYINERENILNNFLKSEVVNLSLPIVEPAINQNKATNLISDLEKIKKEVINYRLQYNLKYLDNENTQNKLLSSTDLLRVLSLKNNLSYNFGVNPKKLEIFLRNEIRNTYTAPTNEVFQLNSSSTKVTQFIPPQNGLTFDLELLAKEIEDKFYNLESSEIMIKNKILLHESVPNTFGIKEKLGSGYSSYKGSDAARKGNIEAALKKIDGLLIEPHATFSLVSALAPFTEENGYVEGLVISGNKIIPEYGGGMCQLGTTIFRAAMYSGLPITERQNHSLWLSWYNDPQNGNPGTDATIYEPAPDFKFKNNTGNFLMLKTRVLNDGELYIEIWGTDDGRVGSYTPPIILNTKEPALGIKTIYVKELAKGKQICNGPFKGATTKFTYNIVDKLGNLTSQDFFSYYRAQQRICEVGI